MLDQLTLSPSQRAAWEAAVSAYEINLPLASDYLSRRGITREGATRLRLGVIVDPLPGHERLAGRLALPYLTGAGVVGLKARCIEDHDCGLAGHAKYDSPAGGHARLYNVSALLDTTTDTAVICEGELDAAVCTTVVGVPAVGTPGTTWLEHWPRCFADYDQVLIVADNDIKADNSNPGLKHAKSVQSTINRARIIMPPPGMDLGEWVQSAGADAVREGLGL